jgi:hypothetical protein
MVYELSVHLRNQFWLRWLNKEILYDNELWTRQNVIFTFVKYDLFPFVKKNGYYFGVSEHKVAQIIARELFHCLNNRRKKISWHSNRVNTDYRQEDLDHFYYIFDTSVWEHFWKKIITWCDVDDDSLYTRNIIEFAVWTCLDLDASPQTSIVNELFETSESDNDSDTNGKVENVESYTEY